MCRKLDLLLNNTEQSELIVSKSHSIYGCFVQYFRYTKYI